MKKILLLTLLLVGFKASAAFDPAFPDQDRFKQYNIKGTELYLVKDTKNGCEYLTRPRGGITLVEGSCKTNTKQ